MVVLRPDRMGRLFARANAPSTLESLAAGVHLRAHSPARRGRRQVPTDNAGRRTTAAGAPGPTPSRSPAPPAPLASSPPGSATAEHAPDRPGVRGRALLGRLLGKLDERRSR